MANNIDTRRKPKRLTANQSAGVGWLKVAIFIIILAVVVYSEYMFLSIISIAFQNVGLAGLAIIGAVATGASVLALIGAKLFWIMPGNQEVAAWLFTGVEIAVMILNDMLGYQLHLGPVTGILAFWQSLTAASPVIALVGWLLVLFLDPAQRERHADLEMQARKAQSEREYIEASHDAEMDVMFNHLSQVKVRLQDALNSPHIQSRIEGHAAKVVDKVLTDITGMSAGYTSISLTQNNAPKQLAPPAEMSLAQEATIEPVEDDEKPSWLDNIKSVFTAKDAPNITCSLCGKENVHGSFFNDGKTYTWVCQECLDKSEVAARDRFQPKKP